MKITIVGSGFVGRATGKGLAQHGNAVTFLDIDEARVSQLKAEGLSAMVPEQCTSLDAEMTMFCVPTPTVDGKIQLEYLERAVEAFAKRLRRHSRYHVVVIRSTVPPGTTRDLVLPIIEEVSGKKAGPDFGLAMQPEYLREVSAEQDFARPWLITIGELDQRSGDAVHKIYQKFDAPIERLGLEEAEFQKYVHNLYNAVKIAFFNEMRVVADHEGWDADAIFRATAASSEGVWNPIYGIRDLGPFDGSCLPKDTKALLQWGDQNGYQLEILRSVIAENARHETLLAEARAAAATVLEKSGA